MNKHLKAAMMQDSVVKVKPKAIIEEIVVVFLKMWLLSQWTWKKGMKQEGK